MALLGALGGACSSSSHDGAPGREPAAALPAECEAYLAGFRACLIGQGRDVDAVDARIAATRTALASSGASSNVKDRCANAQAQLQRACF